MVDLHLDQRKGIVLRAIVREYVRTGQPVGSRALAERYRLSVSTATIRNDMAALEELGCIVQPHTSAGRIPTDDGYRWFVDNWPGPAWPVLPRREQQAIAGALQSEFSGLEEVLDATSQVLSEVTEAVAVVASPPSRQNRLRRLELLRRDPNRATLLLIADTGVVEQGLVEFAGDRTDEDLAELGRALSRELDGEAFEDLARLIRRLEPAPEDRVLVADEIDRVLASQGRERIFRGGTANILSPDKFQDLATAHVVVDVLERPPALAGLFDAARRAGSVLVYIGHENPIREMQACAVVFAPYALGGDRRGTLGVIGPTRMDYPHTISAVELVARSLSGLLDTFGL